jgi:hypothetical protein
MDDRFPVWMHLRLQSQMSIDKIVHTIRRMFTEPNPETRLTLERFATDKTFAAYIKKRALRNRQLSVFFDPAKNGSDDDSDDGDEDDGKLIDDDDVPGDDDTTGHAKVTHEANAIGHYAMFLGRSFGTSQRLSASLGRITKYLQQADVSIRIQDNASTLLLFENIRTTLRARQKPINARIARWLTFGNLVETRTSLLHYGVNELQPYIELCLRYLFLPMLPKRLRNIRMTFENPPPITDITNLYDMDARKALFASEDVVTDVSDMLFVTGDHLTHMSLVYPNNSNSKTHGKLVARELGQALSVYIFFFFKYCKGNRNTQTNRKHRGIAGNTYRLFSQLQGGEWKYLLWHVRDYARKIGLDVTKMGLNQNTSSYLHMSRVAWVASRASGATNSISADANAVKMGFARDHKFYPGLESLREINHARERLGGWTPEATTHITGQGLQPVPVDLHPLIMEMRRESGENPSFESIPGGKGGYKWFKIKEDALYSKEIKQHISGACKSVQAFLKAERNKAQRTAIDQTRSYNTRYKKRDSRL